MTTTLLAVDDSKTMRKVLEITFAGEDEYETVLAESSADALAKLRRANPAVALLDAQLGTESGYDLCQRIKRDAPQVAVIILSSKHQPFDKARASSVGADDFIDKPFDTQQLIDKVVAVRRQAAGAPARAVAAAHPAAAQAAGPAAAARPAAKAGAATGPSPNPAAARPAAAAGGRPAARVGASPAAQVKPSNQPQATRGRSGAAQVDAATARPAPVKAVTGATANRPLASKPAPAAVVRSAGARPAPQAAGPMRSAPQVSQAAPPVGPQPAAAQPTGMQTAVAVASAVGASDLSARLKDLGLTGDQVQAVLALSRDVVEKVVWEVVPVLAETLIKEEIQRLTAE